MRYLNRVGVALSILINVILGGASNQTFSARNWQWKKDNRPNLVRLIDLILGEDHCAGSWINWQIRRPH
jgi:hypothetical protein